MKSVLVITQSFEFGGLETHLRGEITCLSRRGCGVHLATGTSFNPALLPPEVASVTTGLSLGPDGSWAQLVRSVEDLRALIRTHSIDCVHAHPFTSLVAGFLAAELEGIPFIVTLHGPASLASSYGPFYEFLLTSVILPSASLVACVSEETAALASPYLTSAVPCVIANGVDLGMFAPTPAPNDSRGGWLVVSRLDEEKCKGIKDFIRKASAASVASIVIAGDGPARAAPEESVTADRLGAVVRFLGACTDVAALMATADGVAGMGRVVLEGLASCRPVVLVGYDGVKGLLDEALIDVAARANFSGRNLPTIDETAFHAAIVRVASSDTASNRAMVSERYSEPTLWDEFMVKARLCAPSDATVLGDLYRSSAARHHADAEPYLTSSELFDNLGTFVYAAGRFETRIAGNYESFRRMQMRSELSISHILADREARIDELNRVLATRTDELSRAVSIRDAHAVELSRLNAMQKASRNRFARRTLIVPTRKSTLPSCSRKLR